MKNQQKKPEATMIRDMTQGSIPRQLFTFAAPLAVSFALQAIYNVVDMIVVGQVLGGAGLSAVATGGNILHILSFISSGFAGAGQVIIARNIGEGNRRQVQRTIGTLFSLLLVVGIIFTVGSYVLRGWLLEIVNTPAEAYDGTMVYTVTCICGLLFTYGYNAVSAIMRGMGDSKRPFLFMMIASVLNIVLDILFVAFFHMGVFGAALATILGQAVSFIFSIIYLYYKRESFGFDFRIQSFLPDPKAVRRIASLGLPMALQFASISISQTVVGAWVNSYGVSYSAIAGIISKLGMMVGIMSSAISTAGASMVGQNLGAKKYERVPTILGWATAASAVIVTAGCVAYALFPSQIFRIFTSDEAVVAGAVMVIGPMIVSMMGSATRTFAFSLINGSGRSGLNLAIALLDGIVGRVGIAYLMGFGLNLGPIGFWYGDAIAGHVPFLVGLTFLLSGIWKKEYEA